MKMILDNNLKTLLNCVKKEYSEKWKVFSLNGNDLFYINKAIKSNLKNYINQDFLNFYKNEFEIENIELINLLKQYLITKWFNNVKFWVTVNEQEWYFCAFWIRKIIWIFYISWFIKYYKVDDKTDTKLEKTIKEFLEKEWYQELTSELWNIELDIVWNDFMPYKDWVKKAKDRYKENYTDEGDYFNDDMQYWFIKKDREKDFKEYCKCEYDWVFTVKHLLFWESFIWEL